MIKEWGIGNNCFLFVGRFTLQHRRIGQRKKNTEGGDEEEPFLLNGDVTFTHFEFLNGEEASECFKPHERTLLEEHGVEFRKGRTRASIEEVEERQREKVKKKISTYNRSIRQTI